MMIVVGTRLVGDTAYRVPIRRKLAVSQFGIVHRKKILRIMKIDQGISK